MPISDFEKKLREHAVYSPDIINEAPIKEIFADLDFKPLSQGLQARAFRVVGTEWVVKEGRWDLDLSFLFGKSNIPMPAMLMQKVMSIFQFQFLPDLDEIKHQYRMYMNFVRYFGYFRKDDYYFHPNRDLIHSSQRTIRDSLLLYKPEIEKFYDMEFPDKLDEILTSKHKYHNFLPKEYLLYGPSISPENKGKPTYFIVQEFIKGELLHDLEEDDFSEGVIYQLIILIYMILLMRIHEHLLPDTRPRYPLMEVSDWIMKTDNIIASKKRVTFIDTRWFWDMRDNWVKRGGIIPGQIIRLSKHYLQHLLDHV